MAHVTVGVSAAELGLVRLAVMLTDDSDAGLHAATLAVRGAPSGLSSAAEDALRRVLAKGLAKRIVLGGGHLQHPGPLHFGSATLDLLSWLHQTPLLAKGAPPLRLREAPTAADQLLFARAVEVLHAAGAAVPSAALALPWVWMLAGASIGQHEVPTLVEVPSSQHWLLEALRPELLRRWARWCRLTRAEEPGTTAAHGQAQAVVARHVIEPLSSVPERAGFLFDLAPSLGALPLEVWDVERGTARVGQWQRARQARVAIPRAIVQTLGAWEATWQRVGFIDDEYADAKRALARYDEALGALPSLRRAIEQADHLPEVT